MIWAEITIFYFYCSTKRNQIPVEDGIELNISFVHRKKNEVIIFEIAVAITLNECIMKVRQAEDLHHQPHGCVLCGLFRNVSGNRYAYPIGLPAYLVSPALTGGIMSLSVGKTAGGICKTEARKGSKANF